MASKYQDLWLGIALCGLGYFAAFAVHRQLLAVRKVSEVPSEEKGPKQPSADDIKLDSLEKLLPNVNQEIANAATRIVAERAARGLTYELLLRGITGEDEEKRNKSLTSLLYLHTKVSSDVLKPHYGTFRAVVDCLCTGRMMEEAMSYEEELQKGTTFYRSQHYDDTLRLLRQIISVFNKDWSDTREGLATAMRAGLIDRWLAEYPWGGVDKSPLKRRKVFKSRVEEANGDAVMQWIIRKLANDYEEFVREYDRLRSMYDKNGPLTHVHDNEGSNHENDADQTTPPFGRQPPRGREESMEEQQLLRRQRREAMVIGGEGRPFALADIIQHPENGSDDDLATQRVEPVAEQFTALEDLEDVTSVAGVE
ncbi:origin recognition complex subunit 3 [Physcia stellaris]|nr:origin recognition complex subunit 3 [Physcia stellaris]